MIKPAEDIDTLIFDFDGTLADTMSMGIAISNALALKFGYKQINSKEELAEYRNLKTQEALKAIGISRLKLPLIANRFRKRLSKEITSLKPIAGVPQMIEALSHDYKMGIVTSNSAKNIHKFLSINELEGYFSFFSTGISLFKKDAIIDNMIKKNKLDRSKLLLIGDETRDIEAARSAGIAMVSVTWGFHTAEVLSTLQPAFMIDSPGDLVELLGKG